MLGLFVLLRISHQGDFFHFFLVTSPLPYNSKVVHTSLYKTHEARFLKQFTTIMTMVINVFIWMMGINRQCREVLLIYDSNVSASSGPYLQYSSGQGEIIFFLQKLSTGGSLMPLLEKKSGSHVTLIKKLQETLVFGDS